MTGYARGQVWVVPWMRAGFVVNDLAAWGIALAAATLFRYDGELGRLAASGPLVVIGLAGALQLAFGFLAKLYQGGYQTASFDEAIVITCIGLAVGTSIVVADLAVAPSRFVPLSVPFGGTMAAVLGMVVTRAAVRALREGTTRPTGGARTLVVGAGDGGHQLVRSMLTDAGSPYLPVGLLDDDPGKRHLRISGVRVLGTRSDVAEVARKVGAAVLVVAVPSGQAALYRDVAREARRCSSSMSAWSRISPPTMWTRRPGSRSVPTGLRRRRPYPNGFVGRDPQRRGRRRRRHARRRRDRRGGRGHHPVGVAGPHRRPALIPRSAQT